MAADDDQDRERPFRILGTRPARPDATDKVTGRALFGADLKPAGTLVGKVLRSPHAHARIVSLDVAPAMSVPGVRAVVTSADLPPYEKRVIQLGHGSFDVRDARENTLAGAKVRYCGQPVAAVAAATAEAAEEATRRIEIQYEPVPAVFDVRAAMADGAPLVQEDLFTDDVDGTAARPGNVAGHVRFAKGDVEDGFKKADAVFRAEFTTGLVHQGYLEPQTATALWDADGSVTVWCSTQGSFSAQAQVAEVLGIPVSRVKVVQMEVGGAFGGKIGIYLEPVAALLSRKSGRPVRMTMDRREVLEATGPTPGSRIELELGATRAGRIVAARARMAFEAGAFAGSAYVAAMLTVFGPYDIEHLVIDGYDVVVNKPRTAAYRAPCATQAATACESLLDEVAEWAGIDPIEIRALNAARKGTIRADGVAFPRIGFEETLAAARAHPHYASPLGGPNRGRGVASGYWFNVGMQSSVNVAVNADGTVSLATGSVDLSGTRTSVSMQLAEALGISVGEVRAQVVDTSSVGYNDVTAGSRVTFATGLAAIEAARDVQAEMARRAAILWNAAPEDVLVEGNCYRLRDGSRSIGFKELAGRLVETSGGPVVGHGATKPDAAAGGAFATHIVDVEVDPDTGKVTILRYTAVQDVGRAVHRDAVEGQMQGGAVQGIGWALSEEYCHDAQGRMQNASLLDYRMPTSADVPWIDTVIVEVPNPRHPFGVRGVGEVPIVPPPAAIANAVYRATGVRFRDLPMKPSRVLGAILEKAARRPRPSPGPEGLDGLVFILDERCNSRCIMCDYWRIDPPARLDPSAVIGFWRRRVAVPPRFVTLTGGEPLLYPQLFEIAAFLKGKVPNVVLSTNGSLLEQHAGRVAELFDKVIVSLDGATPETHRAVRGQDTFEQALRGADALRRHRKDVRLTFKTVLQRLNFRELVAYVRLALDHAADGVALAVPDLASRGFVRFPAHLDGKVRAVMLSAGECDEFEQVIRRLQEEFSEAWLESFVIEGNLTRFLEYFRHHAGVVSRLGPRPCWQGAHRLVVNGKGEVRPCFFLDPIGHIDDPDEGDFYSSEKAARFRSTFDPLGNPTCRQCAQFLDWRF